MIKAVNSRMVISHPIIFFDGYCNLCSASVQFVIKRDSKAIFRFASLQSDYAIETLSVFLIDSKQSDSIILLEDFNIYQGSTAALRIAKKLNGLWPLLYIFIIIPRFIRDAVYNYIATHRYRWFGMQESCWVPTPDLKVKFLDND